MIRLKNYILLLFFIFPIYAFAQSSELDSLKSILDTATGENKAIILNDICYKSRFADPSLAMKYGNIGLEYATKNHYRTVVYLYNNVGTLYIDKGQYDKALENFIKADKIAHEFSDKKGVAMSLVNMGQVYKFQHLYAKALINYNSSLKLFQEIGAKRNVCGVLTTFGSLYYELEDNEKALDYFKQSLELAEDINDSECIAGGLNNIAVIYEEMKNYSKAMEYHKKSLKLYREESNKMAISASLYNIALVYNSQKDYENAIKYIDTAMSYANEVSALESLKEHYTTLSEIYYAKNDFKTSLHYYTLLSNLKDTLLNKDLNNQIVEMSTKYQTEKKEKENQILTQKNELQDLSINRQKIINYSISFGLLLVIGLAFFIYRGYKQKQKANLQLAEKNILIEEKNKIVEEKNKDITDSIRYAKRLQTAILKPENTLTNYFDDGFILFKPKDIVSGDFYWFEKFGNLSLIAAADCTGHGVPGAFMSIIGCNLLSQSVNEYAITQPAAILNSINKGLTKVLQQKGDADSFVTDGMDIALCSFNHEKMIVEYSGAYNPMWIIRDNKVIEFAADKFPVGAFIDSQVRMFKCHEIPVQKGDMIYMFSDGYADQFGGPLGKKFKYKPLQNLLLANYKKSCLEQRMALNKAFESWTGNRRRQMGNF